MEIKDIDELDTNDLGDVIVLIKEFMVETLEDMNNEIDYLEEDIKNREKFDRPTYTTSVNRERLLHKRDGFTILSNRIEQIFKANNIEFENEEDE